MRKQLGPLPSDDHDVTPKVYVDTAVATRYVKPPTGIPGTDLADSTIGVPKLSAQGASPTTFLCGNNTFTPIIGNNILVTPDTDYTLEPPVRPLDGELVMFEIRPTTQVTITVPGTIRLTAGMVDHMDVPGDTSALIGLRWSPVSVAWQVIAQTMEV